MTLRHGDVLAVETLDGTMPSLQKPIFQELGLIMPLVRREPDNRLGKGELELDLNGRVIAKIPVADAYGAIGEAVKAHAAELMTAELVEYYLTKLSSTSPRLVAEARQRVGAAAILSFLQGKLREQKSIRGLAGLLEELLGTA